MLEPLNLEQFKKDYNNLITIENLAEKNYVSTFTITNWIKKLGLKRERKTPVPDKDVIQKMVNEKALRKDIAKAVGIKPNILDHYLEVYGIKVEFKKYKKSEIDKDKLYRLRVAERQSYRLVAKAFNVSSNFIREYCHELGFPDIKVIRKKGRWERASLGWK